VPQTAHTDSNRAHTRFEPFTKPFFDEVLDEVYSSDADPHPHRLALVFAVLALSALFDPVSASRGLGAQYHSCTRSALTIGDFLNDVSVASLCAMHLICGYVLNAEGRLDELYVLVGLALRLATAAGFHKGESSTRQG
jgi:hypothetical protein